MKNVSKNNILAEISCLEKISDFCKTLLAITLLISIVCFIALLILKVANA